LKRRPRLGWKVPGNRAFIRSRSSSTGCGRSGPRTWRMPGFSGMAWG